jgi:[ribosomal protein S5]-alanine N-acetyltransferase
MNRIIETDRLLLKTLNEEDASAVLLYFYRNREFLEEWEPEREASFYTLERQKAEIAHEQNEMDHGRMLKLWIFKKEDGNLIGSLAFSNIVRGAFLSCFLGYRLDGDETGKGYMTEAIKGALNVIFGEFGLHRVEANIMPKNRRSLRVTEKLGFRQEGYARKYLKINGVWEDHIHMVLINESV